MNLGVVTASGAYYGRRGIPVLVTYVSAAGVKCHNGAAELTAQKGLTLKADESTHLSVSLSYGEGVPEPARETITSCTLTVQDPDIVTLDDAGNITAIGAGSTKIKVQVSTRQGNTYVLNNIPVTVEYIKSSGLKCYNGTTELASYRGVNLNPGESVHLDANLEYEDSVGTPYRERISSCTMSVQDPGIVTLDNNGNITAVGSGSTVLTVTAKTAQGNTYVVDGIPVTVSAPAAP